MAGPRIRSAGLPPGKTTGIPERTLRDRWAAKARAVGYDRRRLVGKVVGKRRPPPLPPVEQLTAYLLGPAGLTAQATGFDRRDLLQAICQALPAGAVIDRAALEALAARVMESRDVVRLVSPTEDGPRWTTTELLRVEQAALGFARDLASTPGRDVPPVELAAAMSGRTLSGEQQAMVERPAAADGLAVVVGPAGAGKTVEQPGQRGRLAAGGVNQIRRTDPAAERLAAGSRWVDTDLIFTTPHGSPVDPRNDYRAWRSLLEQAGVRPARLHDARHTAATLLLAQGVPARVAMQILGHSQITLTLGTYSHVVPELAHDAAAADGPCPVG